MHSYSVITLTHTRAFVSNLTTQFCWCPLGLASRECLYLPPPHPADAERKTRQGVTSVYRWYRQCYATYQSDPIGVKLLDELGTDNIMWGSDFPHPDGIYPDSQEYIEKELGHLPADIKKKIVCDNAARLYRFTN